MFESQPKHNSDQPGDFACCHCKKVISIGEAIGTKNRNHCPACLWSKHVDNEKGDRLSHCGGTMKPIALTFKNEGVDKYGKLKQGEIMLVHRCEICGKINLNRIAADDNSEEVMKKYDNSLLLDPIEIKSLEDAGIRVLDRSDRDEIEAQLFGRIV